MTGRPSEQEYPPYFANYVAQVPEDDVLAVLRAQADGLRRFARNVPADRETFAYAPGKWTVREVAGHLGDTERVFGHRAFCFSRRDPAPLASYDDNLYVANGGFAGVPVAVLVDELLHVRAANLAMLERLDQPAWLASGTAGGNPITVRAMVFVMAGHVRHHLRLLRERYGLDV